MSETRSTEKRPLKTPLSPVEQGFVRAFRAPPGHEGSEARWRRPPPTLPKLHSTTRAKRRRGGPLSPGSLSSLPEDPDPEPTSWLADASSSEPVDSESEEEEAPRGRRPSRDGVEERSRERRPRIVARSRSSETLPAEYANELQSPRSARQGEAEEPQSPPSDSSESS